MGRSSICSERSQIDYGQDIDLAFTHDKIREVLYQWLNPLRRRALQRQASQAIESRYAERLAPYYSTLAYHYQMAEELAQYAVAGMLHDADLQSRVLWSRSVCAGWQGDWTRAISDILAAIQVAQHESETLLVYPYLLMQAAKAYFFAGKSTQARFYLDQGMELAHNRQYRQLPAIGQRLQGRVYQAQGKYEEAKPCFERSLAELLALDDVVEYARTQEAYGLFFLARKIKGDVELGRQLMKRAQETFKRLGVNG